MKKYDVTGMSCAACVARIEKAVEKVDGVEGCTVSLLTNTLGVEGTASEQAVIAAVERAGYGARAQGVEQKKPQRGTDNGELKTLLKRLIASVVFLLVLLYVSMGHRMWHFPLPPFFEGNPVAVGLLQMLLAGVILVINRKFFISGFKGIFHGAVNMDTLVGLGSGIAFLYSLYVLFAMTGAQVAGDTAAVENYAGQFYFESAAMILTLITVGKTLETVSKGRTTSALQGLMRLAPQTAVVLRDGKEIEVPVSQVAVGDVFVVRPGGNIPVDGEVVEGNGSIDESALTGESIPVEKTVGSTVSAGTHNLTGYLQCRAHRVGEDTTLAQIIRMVSDASATKAPVARIADKVSAVFVPIVLGLALITLIVWLCVGQTVGYALARAISVLVISCPCALGLATPVAIMVGNGIGAKNGILFKTSAALEGTGRTQIVVLDKTGTVTSGTPVVTDILPADGVDGETLLRAAYALESKSEHPLSKAIVSRAEFDGLTLEATVEDFRIFAGGGLQATVDGVPVSGGNAAFVREKVDVAASVAEAADRLAEAGKTPLYFVRDGVLLGLIAVADTVRDDSVQAIRELKDMGLKVVMLTGDNARTAAAIGAVAGVDAVIADVKPQEKERAVRALQRFGKVMMVGDGINDAPALTSADVGVAIGAGTDVAIDAAEVVLVKSRLRDVPASIRLSRATLTDIKQNLFWAFVYNVIGIPLAAGVWVPLFGWEMNPMFGAAAMSLSSICVVLNALRLNLFDMRKPRKSRHKPVEIDMQQIFPKEDTDMENKVTLQVEGMMCGHCEKAVRTALEALDGVVTATADHTSGQVVVTLEKDVPRETLVKTIEALDYKVVD